MKTIRLSRLLFERYTTESENLTNILNKHNIPYEILENTKDIWMRDFMPFCLDDGTLVSYIYEPDYLQGVKYKNIKTKINYEINHICFHSSSNTNQLRRKKQDFFHLWNRNTTKTDLIRPE